MKRIILPIVYEDNDPVKIREAFRAGCGGVIVKGVVPDAVAAEVRKLSVEFELLHRLQREGFGLRVEDGQGGTRLWTRNVPELQETCRWLDEEYAQVKAGGLNPPVPPGSKRFVMTAWFGREVVQPWHIDKIDPAVGVPSMHIHIHGKGMVVAVPPQALSVAFRESKTNSVDLYGDGREEEEYLDYYLKDRGVEFIMLQPGQRLYFNDACLHKSSYSANSKIRAAIF